ncbi:DEAD/DEAH box helicase [Enterococcus saccharolyticus]|uniref:Snf2 family helicase n=1 Tax=Candidatus Enterococcus willemsii TaxID=1857215 RepID=A0ABQ6YXJ7_9ENTE|nr:MULTISPECIES: DEAD/DEAH box helicase [Enterococcus]KAF1302090.1 Snf2 family helicase [Enterococcus sp. CU12B]MCD5002803.1 DEAD/DEAH box helicase [Enterococcus saccharolyticus]
MKWSIPEKIIEKGRTYLNDGRVLSVTPDAENQVWHAEVLGSELYRIDLDASAKEEDYCQCPYWEEHHYCKHTVAVELYLRKQGKTRMIAKSEAPKKEAFSPSVMFSNGFRRLAQEQEQPFVSLGIECQLDSLPTNPYREELDVLGISLKIGEQNGRTYVVKNIYKFLQVYEEEKTYLANKQNSFLLTHQAFDDATNRFLAKLSHLAQTQQLMGQTGIQVKGKLDKKYLLLPIEGSQEMTQAMLQFPFILQTEEKKVRKLEFPQVKQPLQFSVVRHEDQFDLRIVQDFDHVYKYYGWGLINDQVYQLTTKELDIYLTMEQLLKRLAEPKIAYPKKELSILFKQVLPLLKQLGTVQISDEVYHYISDEDLHVIFYLKKRQGNVELRVDYVYGDVVFSTDTKHQITPEGHAEILRDYKKEQRVELLVKNLDFLKNETGWQKPLPEGEALYRFFTHELSYMRQLGDIRMGKKLRERYIDGRKLQPQIEVSEAGSWLDVSFDISGIAQNEIDMVLQSLLRNDQFYTMENGQVLSLNSEEFQETSRILSQLRESLRTVNGVAKLPLNQGLQLQEQLGDYAHFSQGFEQMVTDLTHPEAFSAALPQGLQAELREYQVTGFRWLKMLSHYQFGGILADEMGLGKTLQTISYLLSEKEEKKVMKALIVAPASLTYNWQQEIKKFAPSLRSVVISGNKEERETLMQPEVDVWITSYASLRQDIEMYQAQTVDYLILDEAQMVKNSSTKTAQALRSLHVAHRFALSGTPIENNLEELWALFQMIMPGFFPSRQAYRELSTEKIAAMIQPFILRRDKRTVLKDLPEKLETNYYSALTDEQKTVYLAYLRQMRDEISGMDSATFKKNRISILAGLTRLRQICCDPKLFVEDYEGGSGKLEQVKDLIRAAKENNRRVLLFSQFTSMLSIIEEELAELGLETFYLRGSTPPKERIEMVDAFNAGEKDVFLISLKAGGTGLNLTGADTVILYDLWWNPAVEEQAAGRAHRIGQKRVVEVWRMIAEGTIEERMNSLQQEKRELFQRVIQGNETQLQQMTEEDIRLILSVGE